MSIVSYEKQPLKGGYLKRFIIVYVIIAVGLVFSHAEAQKTHRLSIATGGTGGVYYPMGGGMAKVLSKYIPYMDATAEVTTASVDNCLLVGKGKADLAFVMGDTAWDAYMGLAKFKEKFHLRTVLVLYPNNMHIVTLEGKGVEKVADLKGKRVSTGAPGSGTEIMALRVIEAYGLNPDKDMKRDKLGASESAGALKDGKIDAFFWVGGLPTASVTDLGATPGVKIKLIGHADALSKMKEKYGPIYVKGTIPAKTYPGQNVDVPITVVWNVLLCHENMSEKIVYDIVKAIFDHKQEIIAVHKDASFISLETQATGASPIPLHPGAIRYFKEKGIKIK
jgi:TRAP transporter TAXI family solute receptor